MARVLGFPEYKNQKRKSEMERDVGKEEHLKLVEEQNRQYQRDIEEYKRLKRTEKPLEETPAYQEQLELEKNHRRQYQASIREYEKEKRAEQKIIDRANLDPMEELGLPENRPRFNVKNRPLYGAPSPYGKLPSGTGSSSGFSPPTDAPPDRPTFMPPQGFDEYVPPPSFSETDNFDLPPPPPMPMESDIIPPQDDFFPPPPPPPPPLEPDDQF